MASWSAATVAGCSLCPDRSAHQFRQSCRLELLKAESLTQILGLRPEEFLIAQHHQTVRQLFEIGKNERIPGPQYFQCKALDGSRIDLKFTVAVSCWITRRQF
jgi:hypothetical protein